MRRNQAILHSMPVWEANMQRLRDSNTPARAAGVQKPRFEKLLANNLAKAHDWSEQYSFSQFLGISRFRPLQEPDRP